MLQPFNCDSVSDVSRETGDSSILVPRNQVDVPRNDVLDDEQRPPRSAQTDASCNDMSSKDNEDQGNVTYSEFGFATLCPAVQISCDSTMLQDCFIQTVDAEAVWSDDDCAEEPMTLEARALMPSNLSFDATYSLQYTSGYSRPMFIYCHVIKQSADSAIGVNLRHDTRDGIVRIRKIDPNSAIGRAKCLQVGDHVIAVNGHSVRAMTVKQIADLVRSIGGSISITVRNENGDPSVVLNSIQKHNKEQAKYGLAVRNDSRNGGKLIVSKIRDDSPLMASLLNVGQHILMINNVPCSNLPAPEAAALIRQSSNCTSSDPNSPTYLTVLSTIQFRKTLTDLATVISFENKTKKKVSISRVLAKRYPKFIQKMKKLTKIHTDIQNLAKIHFACHSKNYNNQKRIGIAVADSFTSNTTTQPIRMVVNRCA